MFVLKVFTGAKGSTPNGGLVLRGARMADGGTGIGDRDVTQSRARFPCQGRQPIPDDLTPCLRRFLR